MRGCAWVETEDGGGEGWTGGMGGAAAEREAEKIRTEAAGEAREEEEGEKQQTAK